MLRAEPTQLDFMFLQAGYGGLAVDARARNALSCGDAIP
jgi:hypothetical protein